jgi:hypothetical protein
MHRRELFAGSVASLAVGTPTIVHAAPEPSLFLHPCWRWMPIIDAERPGAQHLLTGQDKLRVTVLKAIDGMYVGAHRTAATQRVKLQMRWTFEAAYDDGDRGFIQAVADAIAAEMDLHRRQHGGGPIQLVAVDTNGVLIDPKTFEPVVRFYFEKNA